MAREDLRKSDLALIRDLSCNIRSDCKVRRTLSPETRNLRRASEAIETITLRTDMLNSMITGLMLAESYQNAGVRAFKIMQIHVYEDLRNCQVEEQEDPESTHDDDPSSVTVARSKFSEVLF